ncbi:MAG: hypothetical protein NVS3B5_14140 [Sphingomicrobium sp.]
MGLLQRWRERDGRNVRIVLHFDDLMAFALALLSAQPAEIDALGWSFADRKRLLDHFLVAGKAAQGLPYDTLGQAIIAVDLPQGDIAPLQRFARRSLPMAAPDAAMLDRVLRVLDAASLHLKNRGRKRFNVG